MEKETNNVSWLQMLWKHRTITMEEKKHRKKKIWVWDRWEARESQYWIQKHEQYMITTIKGNVLDLVWEATI